jgi:anti-sigma regulatory factor (Ser/Thr protein kinase)
MSSHPRESSNERLSTAAAYADMLAEQIRPAMEIEIKLDPTPHAPRQARNFVTRQLEEQGYAELIDNGALIVSELVTNSITNAPGTPLWVDLRRAGRSLLLEVWDCSPEPPVFKSPDVLALGGRGLYIVDELAVKVGCETFVCGKCVWALLL